VVQDATANDTAANHYRPRMRLHEDPLWVRHASIRTTPSSTRAKPLEEPDFC
jgi:hypothetical protein